MLKSLTFFAYKINNQVEETERDKTTCLNFNGIFQLFLVRKSRVILIWFRFEFIE